MNPYLGLSFMASVAIVWLVELTLINTHSAV